MHSESTFHQPITSRKRVPMSNAITHWGQPLREMSYLDIHYSKVTKTTAIRPLLVSFSAHLSGAHLGTGLLNSPSGKNPAYPSVLPNHAQPNSA